MQRICAGSVSTHALREEGDADTRLMTLRLTVFQSTPSARRATDASCAGTWLLIFQSTPSARRATCSCGSGCRPPQNFNPRSPWGERPPPEFVLLVFIVFQSTPSARRATLILFVLRAVTLFQSTPSARRATHQYTGAQPRVDISIHALREEGDVYQASDTSALSKFQSTPSARRAT